MSEAIKAIAVVGTNAYSRLQPETQRSIAVAAALELILARVTSAPANGTHLDVELGKLSQYADQIQAAVDKT